RPLGGLREDEPVHADVRPPAGEPALAAGHPPAPRLQLDRRRRLRAAELAGPPGGALLLRRLGPRLAADRRDRTGRQERRRAGDGRRPQAARAGRDPSRSRRRAVLPGAEQRRPAADRAGVLMARSLEGRVALVTGAGAGIGGAIAAA